MGLACGRAVAVRSAARARDAIEPGRGAILRNHEIHPTIGIVVRERRATLFTVDFQARIPGCSATDREGSLDR